MLRRIPRIVCPRCGRARVTTLLGWHDCPAVTEADRQGRAQAVFWLAALVLLLGLLAVPLVLFWP